MKSEGEGNLKLIHRRQRLLEIKQVRPLEQGEQDGACYCHLGHIDEYQKSSWLT